MQILLFLFGTFLTVGLFMLLANALKIPYLKTSKAVMNAGRSDKKLSKSIEAIMLEIAVKIGKIIPIDKYKKSRLESTLKSAGIKMTPETFTALALLKAFCIAVLAIPCAFFMPLLFQRPFNILNAAYLQTAEYNKKTVTP